MPTKIYMFFVSLSLALASFSCAKDGGKSKGNESQTNDADATVAPESVKDGVKSGDIVYSQSGEEIVYKAESNKRCKERKECANVSNDFLEQCVNQGFEIVTYNCCDKACSGHIR